MDFLTIFAPNYNRLKNEYKKIGIDLLWRIACKCACSSLTTLNFDAIYCSDFESNTTPFKNLPLTTVNIGNSVQRIPDYLICNCSRFISLTVGTGVSAIGDSAFIGCNSLTSIIIPNSVISIGNYAFFGCSGLTSVTIGSDVASIGNQVFSGCSDLISLVSLATIPPIIGNEFFPSPNICDVTIPCCSLGIYTTSSWNDYFNGRFTEGLSFDLSVSANDEAYGRVEVETQSCNVRTLTATPNNGYEFTGWNDGNTENPRTVTITRDTAFVAIFTASGSSLQDVNTRKFAIYPNPAKSFVTLEVEALQENTLLQILDINGRRVRTLDLKAGVEALRIDLGDLPKGVYTIMLGNATKKLIVE